MKELDITQWTKVGEGGNGATYINPAEPGVLLKESYLELAKADDLVQEFNVSKAVYELGVPTPRMIELVNVNGRAAIKCQAIEGKKSFKSSLSRHLFSTCFWALVTIDLRVINP